MWALLYRDGNTRKYATLGLFSKMSKSQAEAKRDELLNEVNARSSLAPNPDITFGDFLEGIALPFLRSKWKRSTAATTENRIAHHLMREYQDTALKTLGLTELQAFLTSKAKALSRSVVAHLRWDLRAIFRLALAEGYIQRDPTAALYTPRQARVSEKPVMNTREAEQYINAFELRERVIAHLALFAGIRPGELLGLQRRHVSDDCTQVTIEQRVYRGDVDSPKTNSSARTVAIPPKTAHQLREWMQLVPHKPKAWVFASENPLKPIWRDNLWRRHMHPKLEAIGLEWATFQVVRRTHASLGHDAGIDPKVSADQRGHGIGVAIDVYTKSALSKRAHAAEQLENVVLTA